MGRKQRDRAEDMRRIEEEGTALSLDSGSLGKRDPGGSDGLHCPIGIGQF